MPYEAVHDAETLVRDLVEKLRDRVVLAIVQNDIKSFAAQGLREQISAMFSGFAANSSQFVRYLESQWSDAITVASKKLEEKFKLGPTGLASNASSYASMIANGFSRVMADADSKIQTTLTRASLSAEMTKERVLDEIGVVDGKGIFASIENRAAGVVLHEMQTIAADAQAARSREIASDIAFKAHTQTLQSIHKGDTAKMAKGKKPLMISVWLHSKNVMIFRPNHLDMNGKGIVLGENFTLIGKDGKTYYTPGPKHSSLPIGETANCHCRTASKVVWVTEDEEAEIRQEAARTGGYVDKRWYAESEEFQMS